MARACGGCALIDLAYDQQLRLKTDRVREALAGRPGLGAVPVEGCLPAPVRAAYRNRAKLAVARESEGVRIGLFSRGTNRIVDLAPCRVQRPAVLQGIERLRTWLERHDLARPSGPVFYADLREAAGGRCHLTLVVEARALGADLPVDRLVESWPELVGVAVNRGDPRSSYPMGPDTRPLHGPGGFEVTLPAECGRTVALEVPAGGFFQVAPSALGLVHSAMIDHLGSSGRLYDLYCGVGTHGLAVELGAAKRSGTPPLLGIESSEALVRAARRNAERLKVVATYRKSCVERALPGAVRELPPQRIVLNPGRAGCRDDVVDAIADARPSRVAYLSCNPATLARDLSLFAGRGLAVSRVVPVDLMPHTDHIEVLALLDGRPR